MHVTLKLMTPDVHYPQQRAYSAVFRYAYERTTDGLGQREIRELAKELWPDLNSWTVQCAILDAIAQHTAHRAQVKSGQRDRSPVVWGGKGNFVKLSKGKITKENWQELRLRPMVIQGEAGRKSNRLFDFSKLDQNIITYKPIRGIRIDIPVKFGRNQLLQRQYLIDNIGKKAITVQLKQGQVGLMFEQEKLKPTKPLITNRVLGIDMNPNYIGVSIVDFKDGKERLIKSRIYKFSNKTRSDADKRDHETKEIAHSILRLAKHHRVAKVGIEKLTMGSKDNHKGRNFNRLVNNEWNRESFEWMMAKLCDHHSIQLLEVNCAYSSTIGNLLHPELPDAAAAAWEIARRAQYIYQKQLCMYPPLVANSIPLLNQWKKEGWDLFTRAATWVDLHNQIKNAKLKYRNQLGSFMSAVRDFSSSNSGILVYTDFAI